MIGCLSLFWGFECFLIINSKHAETEDHRFSGLPHPLLLLSGLARSPPIPSENRESSSVGKRFSFLTSLIHCLHTGEDPLVDDQNERDINSVAGVLKLYFRGLENPLFPKERFQDLISTISKYFPGGQPIDPQVFIEVVGLALYPARHERGTPWSSESSKTQLDRWHNGLMDMVHLWTTELREEV